jgi:hypothetical protein
MKHYIKVLLLACIATLPLFARAQSGIVVNRVQVKDSLSLNGKWIRHINADSTLQSASDRSIATDAAVKKYIDKKVAKPAAGQGDRSDSVLTVDKITRELVLTALKTGGISTNELMESVFSNRHAFRFNYMGIGSSPEYANDSIYLSITSSDSIHTDFTLPYEWFDYVYAYGTPPFSLKAVLVNRTSDRHFYGELKATNPMTGQFLDDGMQYHCNTMATPGDSMVFEIQKAKGSLFLNLSMADTATWASQDSIFNCKGEIINNTTSCFLDNYGFANQLVSLPPGESAKRRNLFFFNSNNHDIYLDAYRAIYSNSGRLHAGNAPIVPTRLSIYKNDQLLMVKEFAADENNHLEMYIDNTWKTYSIILDDNW